MSTRTVFSVALIFITLTAASQAQEKTRNPPEMTQLSKDVKPFEYVDAKVPFYPAGKQGGVTEKPLGKMQKPLTPAESMKHIVHPVEFELKLFASDPDIRRPICMNWDERGRLWIAESVDYPNDRQDEGKGNDRIVICEDTDGDGKADKFTVFADKLSIPTGFTFASGGIIVVQAPHTLFLKSTKGDDKADVKEILFTGWGTGDTHAGPSNLHYGFDNWIYGVCGYSGLKGTVGGEKHAFNQGFFRFKLPPLNGTGAKQPPLNPPLRKGGKDDAPPLRKGGKEESPPLAKGGPGGVAGDGIKLEFLRSTNNNTWGLGFSEEGHIFGSTANGNPSVHLPIPNRYYEQVRGWSAPALGGIAGNAPMHPITDKVRQVDYHGHFTAAAGHALYTARAYPKEYWNRIAFICEPTGHLVAAFEITPDGASFKSRNAFNLVASDDEWFAPIMAEVGPDGNVWICDWYNYIVQHNPTPPGFKNGKGNAYETPLRDKTHGRIYRLVVKGQKPAAPMTLKDATPEKLVATLKHDNLFWRKHAQRLLVEHGKIERDLTNLVDDNSVDEMSLNVGVIHALRTLEGLGGLREKTEANALVLSNSLKHKSASVRSNTTAVLPRTEMSRWKLFVDMQRGTPLADPDPNVRLATLLAWAEMPGEDYQTQFAAQLISDCLCRAEYLRDPWMRHGLVIAGSRLAPHCLRSLAGRKKELDPSALDVVTMIAEHYARSFGTEHLRLIQDLPKAHPTYAERVLVGFAKGWPKNYKPILYDDSEKALLDSFAKGTPAAKASLIQLATVWGSQAFAKQSAALVTSMLETVTDEKQPDDQRLAAARQAVELRPDDGKLVEQILEVISPRTSPQLASGMLDALGSSQSAAVGTALTARLNTLSPQARVAALRVLLRRPDSTRAFLDAVDKGKAQLGDLALDQKQALANHPDRAIADRAKKLLERGGGLPSPDRVKVVEQFLPLIKKTGDAAAGKAVFKKVCATCHLHGGEGNKIGPDLTGVAVHSREHLLTDILDPNRSVEGNFRVYVVTTDDGKVLNGLLASESKTAIELYDAEGKKHVLLRENIEQLAASNKSLMPEGFEKQLKENELVDLLTFLTQRGKFLPLALAKAATIVSTRGMFFSEDADAERLIFKGWSPQTFDGVPFHLVDPQGDRTPNAILLYGPQGKLPPKMPKTVSLPVGGPAKAIHFLSGVSGWGFPLGQKGSVTMTVRLHYADGKTEDHPLKNGEHFADYIRRIDVPGSKFAFALRGQQLRYLAIYPQRPDAIDRLELIKGPDPSAPVVMAITVETR